MARPGRPGRNGAARSFRQLRRFRHVINWDRVFGFWYTQVSLVHPPSWADFITTMVGFKVFGTHSQKPPPPTANGMLSACYRAWVGFGRGIGGLGIRDLEPPPLLKPSAEPGAHIFRATPLCAPPNLSQTIGINVILFELHCAAPYEL